MASTITMEAVAQSSVQARIHTIERAFLLALTLFTPLLAHFALSPLGFNPSDDGFILAYSRRILDGQIPHRDFISIRPIGSALLHLPVVWAGGNAVYWLDRLFVWAEFSVIALAWVVIGQRCAGILHTHGQACALYLLAFFFSSNVFPIMAWHTVDGLCLLSVGLVLALRCDERVRLSGYALIGAAVLCKQNYLVMGPLCLVLLNDVKRWRYWIALALPPATYIVALALLSALPAAVAQLLAQSDLMRAGFTHYALNPNLYAGLLVGAALARAALAPRLGRAAYLGGLAVLAGAALTLTAQYTPIGDAFVERTSFALFGAVLGAAAIHLLHEGWTSRRVQVGLLATGAAWATSISIGYNNPSVGAGPLAVTLVVMLWRPGGHVHVAPWGSLAVMVALVSTCWISARTTHIYLDQSASHLTVSLDNVLPGGAHIRTNARTAAFLVDLQGAVRLAQGHPYAIIPDCAGYWVASREENPLPIDWPQGTELDTPALVKRVTDVLYRRRRGLVVIVQRVYASSLATGAVSLSAHDYAVVSYIERHDLRTARTRYFDIYT